MSKENYWKQVARDKWIWIWFLSLIALIFVMERQYDKRVVLTETGVFQDAVCFRWSRYERAWKMRILVDGDVVSMVIPQENCEFFMSLERDVDEIKVKYSRVGNGNTLLNAWYHDKPVYDSAFEADRNAWSLNRIAFYIIPVGFMLWRMINIVIERVRLAKRQ